MRIFLSWSGEPSKKTATELKGWLQNVFTSAEVWMSAHDLSAGSPWSGELHQRLREADFGVLCVTRTNQHAPWLVYECGCLVMTVKPGRLVPLLIDLPTAELLYPLAQLQAATLDREGLLRLVESINLAAAAPLPEERIKRVFDKWWPDFAETIAQPLEETSLDGLAILRVIEAKLLDNAGLDRFKNAFLDALRRHPRGAILDLSRVEFASSAFFGVLIMGQKIAARTQGELVLAGTPATIQEFLNITRLAQILRGFPDVAAARAALELPPRD